MVIELNLRQHPLIHVLLRKRAAPALIQQHALWTAVVAAQVSEHSLARKDRKGNHRAHSNKLRGLCSQRLAGLRLPSYVERDKIKKEKS